MPQPACTSCNHEQSLRYHLRGNSIIEQSSCGVQWLVCTDGTSWPEPLIVMKTMPVEFLFTESPPYEVEYPAATRLPPPSSVENHGCHAAVSGKPRWEVHSCAPTYGMQPSSWPL